MLVSDVGVVWRKDESCLGRGGECGEKLREGSSDFGFAPPFVVFEYRYVFPCTPTLRLEISKPGNDFDPA